ncbi:SIMPL domain-containing protein [Solwaraspora sp. WMMD1047]|uniref:SIMPL domain-containing protein n=1 Tax=Solwaraspora sp. WMMD1047 TaxID=3016102 RepID=UPI002417BB18|nr:SIMPL domain-containing protein [Solwaraspora sp. WMMD1047]MDG4833227.1 SIMPL domain-containing protein [Solwaraspora sp. WMMD1047]
MVDAPIVAVRGEVVREVPPEIARFSVTVAARQGDRPATLARLTERAEAIRGLLDRYGPAIERRDTADLSVRPEVKGSRERVVAYHGRVTTTVTVTDFEVLGELMLRLADQDQTSVSGPWWALRPGSPVHRDARRDAIAEAVGRAREYAGALGARVLSLVELADTGMTAQPVTMTRMSYGMARHDAGGAGPELDLDPQPQTVHASVEARFTISEPEL